MARSIGSGIITFGLVTIPFKVYTAVSEQSVSMNMLHKDCGSRVKQQLVCPVHNVVIDWADTVRGYEHVKDQYVVFSAEELASLKDSQPGQLVLEEFVPEDTVDLLYIERSYYIGPDKGGATAYSVLATAMREKGRIGVGRYAKQGKDVLVLLRPYQEGLVMHEAYYANEVRPWKDVELPPPANVGHEHVQMAELLIGQLERPSFDPSRFRDEYAEKVKALVAQKVAGETITIAPPVKPVVLDLLEALKRSVAANSNTLDTLRRENPVKGPKKALPRKAAAKKKRRSGE